MHTHTHRYKLYNLLVSPECADPTGNVEGVTSSDCHSNGKLCYVRTDKSRPSISAYHLTILEGVFKNLVMLDRMQINYKFFILRFMHQNVKFREGLGPQGWAMLAYTPVEKILVAF